MSANIDKLQETNMKCPIDQSEMEKGFLSNGFWVSGETLAWKKSVRFSLWPAKRKIEYLIAWKCSKCKMVQLSTEKENKN